MNDPLDAQFDAMTKLVDDWKRTTDRIIAILATAALGFAALFFASVGGLLR